jgi:hypothetical protein
MTSNFKPRSIQNTSPLQTVTSSMGFRSGDLEWQVQGADSCCVAQSGSSALPLPHEVHQTSMSAVWSRIRVNSSPVHSKKQRIQSDGVPYQYPAEVISMGVVVLRVELDQYVVCWEVSCITTRGVQTFIRNCQLSQWLGTLFSAAGRSGICEMHTTLQSKNPHHFDEGNVYWRIILKWILEKHDMKV